MKKETRDRKFKCPYNEKRGGEYTMNCLYFGCIHQINDDCPLKCKEHVTNEDIDNG